MTYNIALQFEDGVTRIIPCEANELVSDAAFRAKINIPLDCRDGACGTCKCHCENGDYTLGEYIEDAMTEDEAATGYVLTCQMRPLSDCVIKVPVEFESLQDRSRCACGENLAHRTRLADHGDLLDQTRSSGRIPAGPICQSPGSRPHGDARLFLQFSRPAQANCPS